MPEMRSGDDSTRRRRSDLGRVSPLPRFMHKRFIALCNDIRDHANRHYGTWRRASHFSDAIEVVANAIYWRSVVRFINTLEYLGTSNAKSDRSRRGNRGRRRSDS